MITIKSSPTPYLNGANGGKAIFEEEPYREHQSHRAIWVPETK